MNEFYELWRAIFRIDPPAEQQWALWEKLHDKDIVQEALLQLAVKHRKMAGTMTQDHMVRYGSACMNRLSHERREALVRLKAVTKEVMVPDEQSENRGNR
jgi:hypothetical protein